MLWVIDSYQKKEGQIVTLITKKQKFKLSYTYITSNL